MPLPLSSYGPWTNHLSLGTNSLAVKTGSVVFCSLCSLKHCLSVVCVLWPEIPVAYSVESWKDFLKECLIAFGLSICLLEV